MPVPDPPRPHLGALREHCRAADRDSLVWWYDLGRLLAGSRAAAGRGGRWAAAVAEALREEGLTEATVRKCVRFAGMTTREAAARLAGEGVRWGHVREVVSVRGAAARNGFLRRAGREGWSTRDLRAAVQARRIGTPGRPSRRVRERSGSPADKLARLVTDTRGWLELAGGLWADALRELAERPAGGRLREILTAARQELARLRERAGGLEGEVGKLLRAPAPPAGGAGRKRPRGGGA